MIYTITLNPAIDNIIQIKDQLISGKNNRIVKKTKDVGGKGTHVSIGLSLLGASNICTGITGKKSYEELSNLLSSYGVQDDFYSVQNEEVRQNYVLTDTSGHSSYMITEYGLSLTVEMIDSFFESKLKNLDARDYVVVSGNPSLKTPIEVFSYFVQRLEKSGAKLIADVSGKYLKEFLKAKLFLIKPNEYEFAGIVGRNISSIDECYKAFKEHKALLENVENIAISMGDKGNILISPSETFKFKTIHVNTINDTGSGDAYVSGLVYGFTEKLPIIEIGQLSTAIGASKAEMETSSGFVIDRVNQLKEKVDYERMS